MQKSTTTLREVVIESEEELIERFDGYLAACGEGKEAFPNLAGFCRCCGFGEEGFARLRERYPAACDFVIAALEDVALNAKIAPTLVTAYLKHRLGYGEGAGGGVQVLVDRELTDDGE